MAVAAAFWAILLTSVWPVLGGPLLGRQQGQGSVLEIPSNRGQQGNGHALEPSAHGPVMQIPQRSAGCWRGQVRESDLTLMRVLAKPRLGGWLTKHYRVCFEGGPDGLKVTIADSGVARYDAVLGSESTLVPVFANESEIALSGRLRMVERPSYGPVDLSGPPGVVDERLRLKGKLGDDRVMRVSGLVDGYYNGRPWFVAIWSADFQLQRSP